MTKAQHVYLALLGKLYVYKQNHRYAL